MRGLAMRLLLAAMLCAPAALRAQEQQAQVLPPLPAEQEERYRGLINQLRCLVCQNQTIADSNAPLAADLREQVHRRVAAGESDAQIRSYLTDRYGDFVLYKPPLRGRTAVLWVGPFALLLLALIVALRFMRRSQRRRAPAADPAPNAQAEDLRRLLEEERKP